MKLSIVDEFTTPIVNSIESVSAILSKKDDIRLGLASLAEINWKIRSLAEIYETAETRFLSFLVHSMLEHATNRYGDKSEEWYKLNSENVQAFRGVLLEYLMKLKQSIVSKELNEAVDASKNYFFKAYNLWMRLTG